MNKKVLSTKITILLATCNRANLIQETLHSILAQTYENWECIIVDDFSIDKTKEIIASYIEKDSRFLYFLKTSQYEKGLSGTRNQGLDLAMKRKAKFIQFFDDDDIMHPRKLELKIKPFCDDHSLDLTICCYRKFHEMETIEYDLEKADDQSCNIQTNDLLKSFFLNQINLNSPGPLWRAAVLERYRFNEKLFYAEEREYYLRILLNEKLKFKVVDEILFWYRKHTSAITSNLYDDQTKVINSIRLFNLVVFHETLAQENAPLYILKFFIKKALRHNDEKSIEELLQYFEKRSKYWKFSHFQLFLLLKTRSFIKSF